MLATSLELAALPATLYAIHLETWKVNWLHMPKSSLHGCQARDKNAQPAHSKTVNLHQLCGRSVAREQDNSLTSPGRLSRSIKQVQGKLQKPSGSPCTICSRWSARQAMSGSFISSKAGASTSTPCKMLHKLCESRCCSMLCLHSHLRDCAPRNGSAFAFC